MALNFGRLSIGPEIIGPSTQAGKDRGVKPTGCRRILAHMFIGSLPRYWYSNLLREFARRRNSIPNIPRRISEYRIANICDRDGGDVFRNSEFAIFLHSPDKIEFIVLNNLRIPSIGIFC